MSYQSLELIQFIETNDINKTRELLPNHHN